MDVEKIATLPEIAQILQVTRQGLTQAMARGADPPRPVLQAGGLKFYDRDAVLEFWQHHQNGRIASWRETRREVSPVPTTQINIRVNQMEYAQLLRVRNPNETVSATARRIFRDGLALHDGEAK
jgi:hypothetical protein